MVGQNLGADRAKRAERSAWTGVGISTAVLVTASAVVLALRASLVRIFIADPEVIALGARMFTLAAIAFSFMGIIQVIIGTYQGSGHTVYSMFFSLFRLWVLRIPLVYLLGFTMKLGPDGVWWAMLASNFGAATLSLGWFLTGNWKHRVIKEPSLAVERIVEEAATLRR